MTPTGLTSAAVLLFVIFVLIPHRVEASPPGIDPALVGQPVDQILVSGNERTQERYILKWMAIRPGQPLTMQALTEADQALRDTDLFREIRFEAERFEDGVLTLRVILEERRFSLLLPRISRNAEGDVSAGFRLRMYNLQGADRSLDILIEQEEENSGDDSEQFRLRYNLPLYAKPYELRWQLGHRIKNTGIDDFDNIETSSLLSMSVQRDWYIDGLKKPLALAASVTFEEIGLDRPYPDSLDAIAAGRYNRLGLELVFDDVHLERYRRYGRYHAVAVERGFDWLGSDYASDAVTLTTISFRRVNRYDSFHYRAVFSVSNESPFDYTRYGLGGASSIRGLEEFDRRGDARFFANLEYLMAYERYPALRHNFFIDFGNVYDDLEAVDLSHLQYTIGTGIRWKIQSFVQTDLFLDYGYDVERENGKLYGGTSLIF